MVDRRAIVASVVAFVAVATVPATSLSSPAQYALATTAFAAVLWTTGGLPLPITSLTIPVLLTVFGVVPDVGDAVSGFADPVIFLLIAGFVLAEALQKHGTDRRIAFRVLAAVGTSPRRVVLAVMAATAGLSMVISNSATTAMMVPVALGVADVVVGDGSDPLASSESSSSDTGDGAEIPADGTNHAETTSTTGSASRSDPPLGAAPAGTNTVELLDRSASLADQPNFRIAMVLGVAYAATIGGVGTLIGTPPNAIVATRLEEQLGYHVSFLDWLAIGLPFVAVGLPITWYVPTYVVYPPTVRDASAARHEAVRSLDALGAPSTTERRVIAITAATAVGWLLGGLDTALEGVLSPRVHATLYGGTGHLFGTAETAGLLSFVVVGLAAIPALAMVGGIEWADVARIDWGTIVLLGGGISLANALAATGATEWLAEATIGELAGWPILLVALAIAAVSVAASEIASNTAMAAISVPILITMGPAYAASLGTSATTASVFLAVTGGVAASYGFALPVATPPNAIAFGTGQLTREQMLRPGIVLDVAMILVTAVLSVVLFAVVWPIVG